MMRKLHLSALLTIATLAACKQGQPDPHSSGTTSSGSLLSAGESTAHAATTDKNAPPAAAKGPQSLREQMRGHFGVVQDIQKAIIHDNLETARQLAARIAEYDGNDALEAWTDYLDIMRKAARDLQKAKTLPEAARLSAVLGGQCASCHEALSAITTFPWMEKPVPKPGDVKSHMDLHQWAASRLWEGLVGPSPGHWIDGADAFSNEALHASEILPGKTVDPNIAAMAEHVHELGRRAKQASSIDDRVEIYGELLATCSGCHALTRK